MRPKTSKDLVPFPTQVGWAELRVSCPDLFSTLRDASGAACFPLSLAKSEFNKGKPRGWTRQRKQGKGQLLPSPGDPGVSLCVVCTCIHRCEQKPGIIPPITSCFIARRWPFFAPPCWGITRITMPGIFYVGTGNSNAGLYACRARVLTH